MALEQALSSLTEALNRHAAALEALRGVVADPSKLNLPPAANEPVDPEGNEQDKLATGEAAAEAPAEPAVTIEDVRKAVTAVSNTIGREAAVGIIESFGAKAVGGLKKSDYAAVVKVCSKELAA